MGTVYEALKRSDIAQPPFIFDPSLPSSSDEGEARAHRFVPLTQQIEEQLMSASSILSRTEDAVYSSAFTAHTAYAAGGTALPAGEASRAVGATLDAGRLARADGLVSYDVDVARVEPHLVALTQPHSTACERFRSLRTRVLQAGERKQMSTFVITSAGMGEGKTVTALNLAWLLAQLEGVKTLVIDSDLRQPCATEYLAIDAPRGLSEVLVGELRLREAIVRLDPAGLYLLPSGPPREDVAELLSGPTFTSVIAEARGLFDFVIIDAPPFGVFTDASVLISRADAALLVVRAGKTRFAMIDKLLEQLRRDCFLGVVLNNADEKLEATASYGRERLHAPQTVSTEEESLREVFEIGEEEFAVPN